MNALLESIGVVYRFSNRIRREIPMSWEREVEEIRRRVEIAKGMGGADNIKRQHDGGKLTVRERIDRLLDPGSFHEYGAIAGAPKYEGQTLVSIMPANFVGGTGRINGRRVVVGGDDFTVRGGAADASIGNKQGYAEMLAHELHLPIVRLVDGTGGGGSVAFARHDETDLHPGQSRFRRAGKIDRRGACGRGMHGLGGGAWRGARGGVAFLGDGSRVEPVVYRGTFGRQMGRGRGTDQGRTRRLRNPRAHQRCGGQRSRERGRRVRADSALPVVFAAERVERAAADDARRRPRPARG